MNTSSGERYVELGELLSYAPCTWLAAAQVRMTTRRLFAASLPHALHSSRPHHLSNWQQPLHLTGWHSAPEAKSCKAKQPCSCGSIPAHHAQVLVLRALLLVQPSLCGRQRKVVLHDSGDPCDGSLLRYTCRPPTQLQHTQAWSGPDTAQQTPQAADADDVLTERNEADPMRRHWHDCR